MNVGISIDARETARPAIMRVKGVLQPARLNPVIGRAGVNVYRAYLFNQNRTRPNKLGGKRTNFYATAARGTGFDIDADGVTISIRSVGIRQRFFGGVIKPKTAKFLTIPVAPEAHGKRAREFDLEVVYGAGGRPVALATKSTSAPTKNSKGQEGNKTTARRGVIMFRLVESITQAPDPTVLPPIDQVAGAIVSAVTSTIERAIRGAAS